MKTLLILISPVFFLSACVGPGERLKVPVSTPDKGERMVTAYENGNDNFGPSIITVSKGDYSIVVDRAAKTGYEGMFANRTEKKPDGTIVVTQEPLMASQRASYGWEALGNFLIKGGKSIGYGAAPFATAAVAGPAIGSGIGLIPKP